MPVALLPGADDVKPFIGPGAMKVGGYAELPPVTARKDDAPGRAECGLNMLYSQRQRLDKAWASDTAVSSLVFRNSSLN
jgi:hypothetical protein